jgi:hypothetical protein
MGGLMNYVMIIPAAVFLLFAFGFAAVLARRGSSAAIWTTSVTGAIFLVLLGV